MFLVEVNPKKIKKNLKSTSEAVEIINLKSASEAVEILYPKEDVKNNKF